MSVRLDAISRRNAAGGLILDDVSLEIETGEFVALVGPSGAGKTSLLRVIAGLDAQSGGTVEIDGRDMSALPARARGLGFVFQNYALLGHLSVAANIAFGLRVLPRSLRPSRSEIASRVDELLDLMQLPGRGRDFPAQLSGGQRQRVALARALATRPPVLLLDEPFGALDPMVRKSIRTWLRDLHDKLGLTTILVTHDQQEALEIADRLAVMADGQLVQAGAPDLLEARPATSFVMDFLGDTVRIEGAVRGGVFEPQPAFALPVAVNVSDGPATLMIRPHDIDLVTGPAVLTPLATHGGFARYRVGDAVTVHVPVHVADRVPVTGAALDLGRGHLFRSGKSINTI